MIIRRNLRRFQRGASLAWLISGLAIVTGIYLAFPWIQSQLAGEVQEVGAGALQHISLFSSQYSSLSALFSGFAFVGLIYTILLQRSDIRATRTEVERQNTLTEKRRFEDIFFQLLSSRQQSLLALGALGKQGLDVLDLLFEQIRQNDGDFPIFYSLKILDRDEIRAIDHEKRINEQTRSKLSQAEISTIEEAINKRPTAFQSCLDTNKESHKAKLVNATNNAVLKYIEQLSHYLRQTFFIFSFIDVSHQLEEKEKKTYANMLKAQLADVELAVIFYFVIVSKISERWAREPNDIAEMKALISKYNVLANLSDRFIIHSIHKDFLGPYNEKK